MIDYEQLFNHTRLSITMQEPGSAEEFYQINLLPKHKHSDEIADALFVINKLGLIRHRFQSITADDGWSTDLLVDYD